jgi:bifunctional UDP-N-acetylglucosamine pyrophosphorylase/glucosamine-1-phosphate N-acetyltransferase
VLPGESVGDFWTLAVEDRAQRRRHIEALAYSGVRFLDPFRVWIESTVHLGPGCVVWPDVTLTGATVVEEGVEIGSGVILKNTRVGARTRLLAFSVCEDADIGPDCAIGPMAHLRPGAVLEADVKVGNFVEVKKSTLRTGAKASHLSYLGDAEIGEHANVGAGTITCNYDGFNKHRTEVGAGAFIGSNTALVAPVRIGSGVIVGAGSVITRDVPDDALAVERAEQRILPGKARVLNDRNRRLAKNKK